MSRKPKAVPLSKVDDIQASLKQKAATPKTVSVEELVKSLAKPIQDMLDAGYSYEDVSDVFKGHGVELAASGMKSFHKRAMATNTNKPGSESAVSSDSDSTTIPVDNNPPPEVDAMPPDTVEKSSPSSSQTSQTSQTSQGTKAKKGAAKTNSQFNVTDRSSV